jgi:hypothetical protein
MALTITKVDVSVIGNKKMAIYDITCDTSYPTGGYAITAANFGLKRLVHVDPDSITSAGFGAAWDKTNSKLMLFTSNGAAPAALAQVPNATNVSTHVLNCKVIGY